MVGCVEPKCGAVGERAGLCKPLRVDDCLRNGNSFERRV